MTGRHAGDDFNAEVARSLRATMDEVRPGTLLLAEHAHDATGDLAGDGWHGTMNYAGFTQPVWAWLRHPEVRLPYGGLPLEVHTCPPRRSWPPSRVSWPPPVAVVGDLVVTARVARLDPDPQRGPGRRPPGGRGRAAVHHAGDSDGVRRGRDRHGGGRRPRHPPAVPLAPARDLGPDHPWPLPRAGRPAPRQPRAAPRRPPLGPRLRRRARVRASERQRLLVLAARAGHGPLRLPPAHSAWSARHPTCTATPTRSEETPTAT